MSNVAAAAGAALARIVERTGSRSLLVGFSGGLDSTVLLHVAAGFCVAHGIECRALHVDHRLHPHSEQWAQRCLATAAALAVPCVVERLAGKPPPGASIEQWARDERYRALAAAAGADACVLTAHHRDDQVETVLQRALSGAGPHGLAAMRELRRLEAGFLGRPLLGLRRHAIAAYAQVHGLRWIEDPSNADPRFLRNRLRATVLPALEAAAPAAARNLARLAAIQATAATALDACADRVIDAAALPPHMLAVGTLADCEPAMRGFVLKRWLARAGAPVPGQRQLDHIMRDVVAARADAAPLAQWRDWAVRRHDGKLYVMPAALPAPPATALAWSPFDVLNLPWGTLAAVASDRGGIDAALLARAAVTVRFRRGGERCRPQGRRHSQALKKLLQAWRVPPWERDRLPLIYLDDSLAAVAGHCVCAGFAAAPGAPGLCIEWRWSLYAAAAQGMRVGIRTVDS